jgi:Ca2+-binding RTX toxin-like protein
MNYTDGFDISVYIKGDIKPATIYSAALLMDYTLLTPYAFGETIQATEGDDYLVGIGENAFDGGDNEGGDGRDIFVVSYGSSLDGVALTESVIDGFDVGEDALGFIGLGVTDANFDEWVTQEVVEGDLEISIDRDGEGGDDAVVVATLTGVDEELDMEPDFLLANPGEPTGPGDDEPTVITGTNASETLVGTPGDDIISGLGGSDIIYGLTGADEISGGSGVDRLTGGEGADVFVFETGTRLDIVTDFEDGEDLIYLVGINQADFGSEVTVSSYQTDSTLITVGNDRMILRDVASDLISEEDDFIFEDTLFA